MDDCMQSVNRDQRRSFQRKERQSNSRPSIVPSATIHSSLSSAGRQKATSKGTPFLTRNRQSIRSGCPLSFPSRRPPQERRSQAAREALRLPQQFPNHPIAPPLTRFAAHWPGTARARCRSRSLSKQATPCQARADLRKDWARRLEQAELVERGQTANRQSSSQCVSNSGSDRGGGDDSGRRAASDPHPSSGEELQLLLNGTIAFPLTGTGQFERHAVVQIGRSRSIGLRYILVHRAGRHRTAIVELLFCRCDEIIDGRVTLAQSQTRLPNLSAVPSPSEYHRGDPPAPSVLAGGLQTR